MWFRLWLTLSKYAAKVLAKDASPKKYWASYIAQTINLMLEGIRKLLALRKQQRRLRRLPSSYTVKQDTPNDV